MGRLAGVVIFCLALVVAVREARLATAQPPHTSSHTSDQIARGEFLVTMGGCGDCHTPKLLTLKGPEPDRTRLLAGTPAGSQVPAIPEGVLVAGGWGALATADQTIWAGQWGVSFASNLTPDRATGLGNWTEAAFIGTMRTGRHKGVLRPILPPMPWQVLSEQSDDDLRAIFAHLRSIKPINNKVPDPIPPK